MIPLAYSRIGEHRNSALKKRANGLERRKVLRFAQFVECLKDRMIKVSFFLSDILRHYAPSASDFLDKGVVSRLQNFRGAHLRQIEAIGEINYRPKNCGCPNYLGLFLGRVSGPCPSHVRVILPKIDTASEPVIAV